MKKINASSDKRSKEIFLPAETLWNAAQMVRQKGMNTLPLYAEPTPQEMIGLTIGILRRRKKITFSQLAQKIGCSAEELLALEAGLLPERDLMKYLPMLLREIKMPKKYIQPFLRKIKFV